jgi:putative peptide maturation dehydrogenase
MMEPRERLEFDLAHLSGGGTGLHLVIDWVALAPHSAEEVVLTAAEAAVLGSLSPSIWIEFTELASERPIETLEVLLEKGMLVEEGTDIADRDQLLRDADWRPASAVMHYASRWRGVDTEELQQRFIEHFEDGLLDRLGPAPPPVRERSQAHERVILPAIERSALDALLDGRVTCRNFDRSRPLAKSRFAAVLYRTFGARAIDDYAPGVQLLKKGVPSAGGLHPTEAYLLVRHVEDIPSGLYHYHPVNHALEPMGMMSIDEVARMARRFVGAQSYLVDAQVFVVPVSRFRRNFWKYRNHAKAYRALILDVGHLSQTMYLAATELGLAAFITAAVNEIDIEEAFGLDPLEEGPLAVCGFGIRAPERNEVEFDPLNAVWAK